MFLIVHNQDNPDTYKVQRKAKESMDGNCFAENIGIPPEKMKDHISLDLKKISRSATSEA
jgi:hypothetical protein